MWVRMATKKEILQSWAATSHNKFSECFVWPINVWINWLIECLRLFLLTIIHWQTGTTKSNVQKEHLNPMLIPSITSSNLQSCAIFHVSTEEWVFLTENMRNSKGLMGTARRGQPTYWRSQHWQWMHQRNTAVGEYKSTAPNVSLCYAWC